MTSELIVTPFSDMGMMILLILVGISIFFVVIETFSRRKSQQYRKTLMDMYVAAKIKFLANKDGLNIAEEFESFKKWKKKQNLNEKDLDNVIEGELKERVAEEDLKPKKEKKETKPKK